MVRDNRVKEYIFPSFTVTGSVKAETYSNHVLNGELIKIRVKGITSPGSFWLSESGTSIEFFRKNDFASGDSTAEFYPMVFPVDAANATGSPNSMVNRVVNSEIYYAASGLTSGTSKSFGPITVFYV